MSGHIDLDKSLTNISLQKKRCCLIRWWLCAYLSKLKNCTSNIYTDIFYISSWFDHRATEQKSPPTKLYAKHENTTRLSYQNQDTNGHTYRYDKNTTSHQNLAPESI